MSFFVCAGTNKVGFVLAAIARFRSCRKSNKAVRMRTDAEGHGAETANVRAEAHGGLNHISESGRTEIANIQPETHIGSDRIDPSGGLLPDYELLRRIGRGGSGEVWLAADRRLGKTWAIKIVRRNSEEETACSRLCGQITAERKMQRRQEARSALAEALLLRKLDHPALPRIIDIRTGPDRFCIIMDYIEGDPLDRVIRESGPQPENRVIGWALQVADIFWYLHSRNPPVIYQDMKPSNLILRPEGTLKIIDFGAARELNREERRRPAAGTRGYAPPELFQGGSLDVRSDMYSLGMTIRALLTGRSGEEESGDSVAISGGLQAVLAKCTAQNPEERYSSDAELIYALEHVREQSAAYRALLKKKAAVFAGSVLASLALAAAGTSGILLRRAERVRTYERLIAVPASASLEKRQSACLRAAEIGGADPRSYEKLLSLFEEDGRYTEEESRLFEAAWEHSRPALEAKSAQIPDLLWHAGNVCLYLYTGGDGSFRERILRACSYYDPIRENADPAFDGTSMASALAEVGDFYRDYAAGASGIQEPARDDYENLLEGMQAGLQGSDAYQREDAANLKLIMFREFLMILREYHAGMVETGIEPSIPQSIVQNIRGKSRFLSVTRAENVALQQEVWKEAVQTEQVWGLAER